MNAVERLAVQLAAPMADEAWARDLAERIVAYDPLAEICKNIRFLANDRIVVDYRATGDRRTLTFVVPRWTPPAAG